MLLQPDHRCVAVIKFKVRDHYEETRVLVMHPSYGILIDIPNSVPDRGWSFPRISNSKPVFVK